MTADQQAQATKRLALALRDNSASTLVRMALADYQALVAAMAVDHRPEFARLRAEVARLEAALDRAKAAHKLTTNNRSRKVPCPGCGAPMARDSAQRGSRCRACYLQGQDATTATYAAAVATVNADQDRPLSVMACWDQVAAIIGRHPAAVRTMAERCSLRVVPRQPRLVACHCGKPVLERITRAPVCRGCRLRGEHEQHP